MMKVVLPFLLAVSSSVQAGNILGTTTPFSKSQACRQVSCKLLSETKVGPYVVYTYAGQTAAYDPGIGRYFAIKRNEKNVAVGIYYHYAGSGGPDAYSDGKPFTELEGGKMARLLSLNVPPAKTLKQAAFRVEVGPNILLTNHDAMLGKSAQNDLSPSSFVYAVKLEESQAIARLLNRHDPAGKKQLIADLKRAIGATGNCTLEQGYRDAAGKTLRTDPKRLAILKKWLGHAEEKGMVVASGMDTGQYTVPGLSSTTITPLFYINSHQVPSAEYHQQEICFK